MKCKIFDKLIHLFLDGKLERDKERELKEHLSTCEKCARKLALLKSVEGAAKKIEIQEPSQEYWDTFSSRVREKIMEREEKSPAFRLKKTLQDIFSFSPLKMKVAAGLVSVVLVFIVGKLYVDYRGQEILLRKETSQTEERPQLDVADVAKKGETPQAEDRDRTAQPLDEPKREAEFAEVKEAKKRAIVTEQPITGEGSTAEEMGTPAPPKVAEERGVSVSAPPVADQVAVEGEIPSEQPGIPPAAKQVGAGIEKKHEEARDTGIRVEEEKTGELEELTVEGKDKRVVMKDVTAAVRTVRPIERYMVNKVAVPKIQEDDTLMPMDALTTTVQVWKDFIEENPADSLNREGYLQIAMAYYLLAKLSKDATVISEGSKVIGGYLEQIDDPALKKKLSDRLEKIKALREK